MNTLFAAFGLVSAAAFAIPADQPAYVRRGEEVDAKKVRYTAQLEGFYASLLEKAKSRAPASYALLKKNQPEPIRHGYLILPKIIADPTEGRPLRAISTSYSWRRTDQIIDGEITKLQRLETRLADVGPQSLAKVAEDYLATVEPNRQIVDNHVSYNHFWQAEVARDRKRFDHLTELHDLVLERQTILDALAAATAGNKAEFKRLTLSLKTIKTTARGDLEVQERKLAGQIHEEAMGFTRSPFIKLIQIDPKNRRLEVPLYTDIRNRAFLKRFKTAVESRWQTRDPETGVHYEIKIVWRRFLPEKPPKASAEFDIAAHVAGFPKDGGVLTTGALATYALPGRYIAVGSTDIQENVLAHEFGHILGFQDGYFRGYHDLGADGYEVLEVIPDPQDIMSTPGFGTVHDYHFRALMRK